MNLEQLQRAVFEVTRQPLTPSEKMRPRLPDGRSTRDIANALIKPNARMTSVRALADLQPAVLVQNPGQYGRGFSGAARCPGAAEIR